MRLTGPRVTLRAPEPGDVESRLKLGRDPEVFRGFGIDPIPTEPLAHGQASAWVQRLVEHPCAWVIDVGGLIGEIRLDNVNMADRNARLAVGIFDPAFLGRGLGREAIGLVLKHGFAEMGLHRIGLTVLANNARGIGCYRACGFVEEGRLRETAWMAGRWIDDIVMGILARDWRG